MADSPVLYVYYRPDNDDAYPGVPNRHITEADWARFSLSQRRTVEQATTQDGYGRRKVWLHRDLVDETEQERAEREAAEQAARDAYERGQSIVRWRDFEPLVPGPGEVIVGSADGPVKMPVDSIGGGSWPAELPPIPDLLFHLDAQTIDASDGARIGEWTDKVTGTAQALQETEGQQPLYRRSGINGRPALKFDKARNDVLRLDGVPSGTNNVTVFVVATKPTTSANSYFFGTAHQPKNLFVNSVNSVNAQTVTFFPVSALADVPQIVTGIFNDANSAVRIDGVETSGSVGTPSSTTPSSYFIGQRSNMTAGQGFDGLIGEVLYFNRVLSSGECAAVEAYLSARWAIPVTTQTVWYVDSVHGDDTRTGRTAASAVRTLSRAVNGVYTRRVADATIRVYAPEDAPLRGQGIVKSDGNTLRIEGTAPGATWYMAGTVRLTGGWTDTGGGVYSHPLTTTHSLNYQAFVPTLLDADGQPTRIRTRNQTTPTTPAAGEYGFDAGVYYIHLPGGANPNQHVVEVASIQQLISASSGSRVYLRDAYLRGAQVACTVAGSTTGTGGFIEATDCVAEFTSVDGFATRATSDGFRGVRCVARYAGNDGFNHSGDAGNTAIMELVECEGAWNDDEGVSPHGDLRLILRGGRFHHNGGGGLTSVGNAVTQLNGTEFHHNGLTQPGERGVNIDQNSTLISRDLYSHDNQYGGVRKAATATWIDNGGTRSGTEHGNGAEDAV